MVVLHHFVTSTCVICTRWLGREALLLQYDSLGQVLGTALINNVWLRRVCQETSRQSLQSRPAGRGSRRTTQSLASHILCVCSKYGSMLGERSNRCSRANQRFENSLVTSASSVQSSVLQEALRPVSRARVSPQQTYRQTS